MYALRKKMYILEDKLAQYQRITGKKLDMTKVTNPGAFSSTLRSLVAEIMTLYLNERCSEIAAVLENFPRYSANKNFTASANEVDLASELKHVKVQREQWQLYLPANG